MQTLYNHSKEKLEQIRCEQKAWRRLAEEMQKTAAAEAWLAETRQQVAKLCGEVVDLYIQNKEAAANAKEVGEKLLALLDHSHKDEEVAQKVKAERDELLRTVKRL